MYPADWRNNANLRRCSLAARGAWWEIMCVLHDSDEYGVCRWPLVELLRVAGVPMKLAKELLDRNVMKGSEKNFEGFSYTTRHAGQDGEAFVLIPTCETPVWFSSRMVVDEFVRTRRGASTRFDANNQPSSRSPTGRVGDSPTRRLGDGPTTSSPTPSTFHQDHKASGKCFTPRQTELTARFHAALNGEWENDRQKWMGRIKNKTEKAERVISEVESAIKEGRIKKTPAHYAENIWKEFK